MFFTFLVTRIVFFIKFKKDQSVQGPYLLLVCFCFLTSSDLRFQFWCMSNLSFLLFFHFHYWTSTTKLTSTQCLRAMSVSTWLLTRASGSACCQAMVHTAVACGNTGFAREKADGLIYDFTFKVERTWFEFMYFSRLIPLPSKTNLFFFF